jgi:hypothetical protein
MSRPVDFTLPEFGVYRYAAEVARDYLLTRVPVSYAVTTLVPDPRPVKLVVVRTAITSGFMNPVLSKRRLIIWCYDIDEVAACDTAEMVRGYMYEAMFKRGSGIRDTNVIGEPTYMPDPDDPAQTARAQLTVDILLRAGFTIPGS